MSMGIGVFGIPLGISCLVIAAAVLVLRQKPWETQKKFGLQELCKYVWSAPLLAAMGALLVWVGVWHLYH